MKRARVAINTGVGATVPVVAVIAVEKRTPNSEFWRADGEGVSVVSRWPETTFALAAMDAGIDGNRPFETRHADRPNIAAMRWPNLRVAAQPALRRREAFARMSGSGGEE